MTRSRSSGDIASHWRERWRMRSRRSGGSCWKRSYAFCSSCRRASGSSFQRWKSWRIRAFSSRGSALKRLRSEEHTSELQSLTNLVCRLLLEKKKKIKKTHNKLTITSLLIIYGRQLDL